LTDTTSSGYRQGHNGIRFITDGEPVGEISGNDIIVVIAM